MHLFKDTFESEVDYCGERRGHRSKESKRLLILFRSSHPYSQAFGWKYTLYNVVYDVYQQMTVKLNTYITVISNEMITFCQIHRRQPRAPSSQNVNRNIRCNGEIDLSKKESRISRIIGKWIIVLVVRIVVFSSFKHSSTHGFTKRLMLE